MHEVRGEFDSALEEAIDFVRTSRSYFFEAELHRLRGALLLAEGDKGSEDNAAACFSRSLEIACAQGARSLELRAAVSQGRLWRDQGRTEDASTLVTDIRNWFSEGFETEDLRQADVLLEELRRSPAS